MLLFTDISPACHILWIKRYRLSRIKLPDSSFQLLCTKGLIAHVRSRYTMWTSSPIAIASPIASSPMCYSLSQDDLRGIYAAVDNDHSKFRDFSEILLLSENPSLLAIDLLKEYCKYRV